MCKRTHLPLLTVLALLVCTLTIGSAQDSRGSVSFGVQFGHLSSVRVAYAVVEKLEVSVAAGPALSNSPDPKPSNVGASIQYRFHLNNPSLMVRPSIYALSSSSYDAIASLDIGVVYDLSDHVSTIAFAGPALGTGSGKGSGEMVAVFGVGVMVHLP